MLYRALTLTQRIRDNVASQAKELPSQLQTLAHNVLDNLSKGANEIRAELGRSDAKATERAQNVLKIAQSNAQPVLNEALATVSEPFRSPSSSAQVKSLISASEKKAGEAADAVNAETNGAVDEASKTVGGAVDEAKKTANGVADDASKKADEGKKSAKSAGKKASAKAQDAANSTKA